MQSEMPPNLWTVRKGTGKTLVEAVCLVFACLKSQLDTKCLQPNEVTGDVLVPVVHGKTLPDTLRCRCCQGPSV